MNLKFAFLLVEFMVAKNITNWAELRFQLLLTKHGSVTTELATEPWNHEAVVKLAHETLTPEPLAESKLLEHHNL